MTKRRSGTAAAATASATNTLTATELEEQARAAMAAHAELARNNPLEFNAFVLRDEDTGLPVDNSPTHEAMHETLEVADRILILAHIESGKTSSITVGRTLYELSRDLNMRGAIVSAKEELAAKPLRAIKTIITDSPEYSATFGANSSLDVSQQVRPGAIWQENKFIIDRPNKAIRDPSVISLGMNSKFLGARYSWVVVDDLLNERNTRTAFQRNEVYDWFLATVMGRLTRNARLIFVNTAWHEQDLIHRLARRKIWYFKKFPVCTQPTGDAWKVGAALKSSWPERWTPSRIRDKMEELGGPASKETKKQLLVEAVTEDDTTFDESAIIRCQKRGVGVRMQCESLEDVRAAVLSARPRVEGGPIPLTIPDPLVVHGLDLGGRRNTQSGKTVMWSMGIHEDATRQPVRIQAGRMSGPEIRKLIIDTYEMFGGVFMVENNATQHWIIEFTLEEMQIPIIPFTTGANKADPAFGVESIAIELSQGGWVLPCVKKDNDFVVDDDLGAFLDGLRDYSPETHTSDYVMAAWFARECARRMFDRHKRKTTGNVGVRVIGGRNAARPDRERRAANKSERRRPGRLRLVE